MPDYIVVFNKGNWMVKRDKPCNYGIMAGKKVNEVFKIEAGSKEKALKKARLMAWQLSQIELAENPTTVSKSTESKTEDK